MTTLEERNENLALEFLERLTRPGSTNKTPSEWCCENVELRTTTIKSRFTLRGREYLRAMIDWIALHDIHFQTCCMGTGNGKTVKNIAQLMFTFENDPDSNIYVLPSKEGQSGAREFNNSCVIPTLEATECFRDRLPKGKHRHNMTGLRCVFGGNTMHLAGSNTPAQLAGPRRRRAFSDEMDKFKEKLGREHSADYLLNERTKQVARSKFQRDSTPSKADFGIWPHLMASDLRRRFLPCPHCNGAVSRDSSLKGWFVKVQSARYTVLPSSMEDGTPIPLAEMAWDSEAKRADGTWDEARVIKSARFECPHCRGHILDNHREWMDKNGVWIPTRPSVVGHHGYHLPSFYAPHMNFESSYGGIAKKFLDEHSKGAGMGGYINSELAEVDAAQEHSRPAIEISSATPVARKEWTALMSCDFQKLYPYVWFIVSRWSSFKLQPAISAEAMSQIAETPIGKKCSQLDNPEVAREILRFDPRTGEFPLLDFVLEKKITGEKLTKLFRTTCNANILDFGRYLYREMGMTMPKGGDSEIVCAGHCELSGDDVWTELREIQQQFHVGENFKLWGMHPNRGMLIDAGYMEEHNPEVLRKCFESNGESGRWQWFDPVTKEFSEHRRHAQCRPAPMDCWIPYRGIPIALPGKFRGRDGIGRNWKFNPDDPFKGMSEADRGAIEVLEAASDFYFHRWMDSLEMQKEIRAAQKEGRAYRGNLWGLSPELQLYPKRFTIEMLNAQLNARGRNQNGEIWERGTGGSGKKRHPDHLNDCCRNTFPLAESHGFFSYEIK